MVLTIKIAPLWIKAARLGSNVLLLLLATLVLGFCCFYLLHSHSYLTQWYLSLNSCVYRSGHWTTDMFTPATKASGNIACSAAAIVLATGIALICRSMAKNVRTEPQPVTIAIPYTDILLTGILAIAGLFLWRWGKNMACPAFDEVFSAHNAAGIHPFQGVSYYMLPNNHLLFNLINNLVFHSFADKVVTGRIISLLAYQSFIVMLFGWLRHLLHNRWLAFAATIAMSLQFMVWGFSFQARGYEIYLIAEWGLIISLLAYLPSQKPFWLANNTLCCVVGYFCVPSFLYFHFTAILFALVYMVIFRQNQLRFWGHQLLAGAVVFLCYLPTICFSGLSALADNKYVSLAKVHNTSLDFARSFFSETLPYYIGNIFSGISISGHQLGIVLCLLPCLLLFSKRHKPAFTIGLLYTILWSSFIATALLMKRGPFERNLIGHYSFTLAALLYATYCFSGWLAARMRKPFLKFILFPACTLLLAAHFVTTNTTYLGIFLYGYPVNNVYNSIKDGLADIPAGSTVGCSDESFVSSYICSKNGCIVSTCNSGMEQYYIKEKEEQLPAAYATGYILLKTITDYQVYKKN